MDFRPCFEVKRVRRPSDMLMVDLENEEVSE
jgi:hypothetical protein